MRKVEHTFLRNAKKNKKDEFYTQLHDIESEMQYYKGCFKDKIVYCNCDYPLTSNFYKYFATNIRDLGIKKVTSSSYVDNELNLFSDNSFNNGIYYEYSGFNDERVVPTLKDIFKLKGNGDFRSAECVRLLENADIVVTNPPFSLFREYVEQLIKYKKNFLIIGNINAITYKEIFKLIKENQVWLGVNLGRGISGFIVPNHYEMYGSETYVDDLGNKIISPNNCLWLTNLQVYKRHEKINLVKKYLGNESEYPKYDNYDAINVNRTKDIPSDYFGAIGVPITFLHKHNPDQFEILKFRKGNDEKDLSINGKCPYFRILIRRK